MRTTASGSSKITLRRRSTGSSPSNMCIISNTNSNSNNTTMSRPNNNTTTTHHARPNLTRHPKARMKLTRLQTIRLAAISLPTGVSTHLHRLLLPLHPPLPPTSRTSSMMTRAMTTTTIRTTASSFYRLAAAGGGQAILTVAQHVLPQGRKARNLPVAMPKANILASNT